MDGTFAALTLLFGLVDMAVSHCPNAGCLARSEARGALSVSSGMAVMDGKTLGAEAYLRRDTSTAYGPFQLIYGASASPKGGYWAGGGVAYTIPMDSFYTQLHLMAGLHMRGSGPSLGGPLEFRSGIEFGYEAPSGTRFGLSVDHRSNGEIYAQNPGLETVQFRVSIPF